MKILFLINSLSFKGGSERVASSLANLFAEKDNVDIHIANRDTDRENVAYYLDPKINVIKLAGNIFTFYLKLKKTISQLKPDWVIVHNMGKLSVLTSFTGSENIISLEHVSFTSKPNYLKKVTKLCYRNGVKGVVTLTEKDKYNYISFMDNVHVIPNFSPFNPKNVALDMNSRKIISIGRLSYQKNMEALLQAWCLLKDKTKGWSLEIYGEGELFESLNSFIIGNNLKNVILKSNVDNIEEIYQSSAFIVMSSRYEGLPMVLIEAQTFGLPIISFDCPYGPAEIVKNNSNGILVENQNVQALSKAIQELIESPEKRELFSKQAITDSKRFNNRYILKLWENVLGL